MECREVREFLPAYAEQSSGPRATVVDEHLRGCIECRGELDQYRQMGVELSALSESTIEPPAWLLGTLTETVTERAVRLAAIRQRAQKVTDPRVVAGGAIVAAGVAGALLLRGRRRKRRSFGRKVREALA